ncbi:MAG: hypothetical protein RLN76_11160 [Phycisphaeraceae bacterium]
MALRALLAAGLILTTVGCKAFDAAEHRDPATSSGVLFSARPSTNLGSGDALGEFHYFRQPEVAALLETRPETATGGLDALARDAAAKLLEDVYAVDPMSADDLREALHPGVYEPPKD